jgi:protein-S-isoprenylcysteine O-methyltransferase Ste14
MNSDFIRRGWLWVICQTTILGVVLFSGVYWRDGWKSLLITVLGVCFLVMAALCGISGTATSGRNLTPFPRPSPNARLVQSGIYGLLRHPLYAAVFCASIGWALVWGSAPALAAALALGPFFDAKARREERWLREKFPEYVAYERRVRRFIPWIY